jgi:hypothetical protein
LLAPRAELFSALSLGAALALLLVLELLKPIWRQRLRM